MTPKFGYLGPEATFTEAALIKLLDRRGLADVVRVPMPNAASAFSELAAGRLDGAVVPIENSLEGGVPASLDALNRHGGLQIVAETLVQVEFVIAAAPGTPLSGITAFGTHPHAEAQTRGWIAENLPEAVYVPASSTAAAARDLAAGTADFQAAICPALAADKYGLTTLAVGIGDSNAAVTRFVLVRRPGALPEPTGADTTTLVITLSSNRSGALLEVLEQLSTHGVNMSRIESRPTGDGLGLYEFSIDVQGHVREPRVARALEGVHRVSRHMRFLGSYPSADAERVVVDPFNTNEAFTRAESWLGDILAVDDRARRQAGA